MSKHKGRGKEFSLGTLRIKIIYDCEMLMGRTSAGSNCIMEYRMKRSI